MTLKDHMQLTAAEQIEQWRTRRKLLIAQRNLERLEDKGRVISETGQMSDLPTLMAKLSQYVSRLREDKNTEE